VAAVSILDKLLKVQMHDLDRDMLPALECCHNFRLVEALALCQSSRNVQL